MPCSDSTSRIKVRLDHQDRLLSYDYIKVTCGQDIEGQGYQLYCKGKNADDIVNFKFDQVVQKLGVAGTEDQFFLFLEWDALRTALSAYAGKEIENDDGRYKVAKVIYDDCYVEIDLDIAPPQEMPKIVACGAVDRVEAAAARELN